MRLSIRIIITSFAFVLFPNTALLKAEWAEQTSRSEVVVERFKPSREDKCLLLPIQIQGHKYYFILDTGATITCFDSTLRRLLGNPSRTVKLHTPDGEKEASLYSSPAAKVGCFDFPAKSPVFCEDLESMRDLSEHEIKGALGMDFLKKHVIRIDFVRVEVTFLRSTSSDTGTRIPFTYDSCDRPQVVVSFPGTKVKERFLVDTGLVGGSSEGDLRSELFEEFAKHKFLKLAGEVKFGTALGTSVQKLGRIETISLGGFVDKKLLFMRNKRSALSLIYLSHYNSVTFDFPNKAIYLK